MAIRDDLQDLPGAVIPGFAPPPQRVEDPPLPEVDEPTPAAEPARPRFAIPKLPSMRLGTLGGGIRTDTSSRDSEPRAKVGIEEATVLLAGLLGVATLGCAWLVQRRSRGQKTLRQPSDVESSRIAAPLARIAARLVPADLLAPSLADGIMAMSATGAYLTAGPLVIPNKPVEAEDKT
jgi:hypothetical protein